MQVPDLDACPKRMVYGPCGGVRTDLSCEMAALPCPFVARGRVEVWPDPWTGRRPDIPLLEAARPIVLTDFTVSPFDVASVRSVAGAMQGSCDGVLVGEHQNRPDFPPALMAALVRDAGLPAWITLTCRDRNRVVLEQELGGLALAGAAGVLCVTGDGRARGVRPDVTQVFDIDSTQLIALAADAGLAVAAAEAPDAPPHQLRAGRLFQKQRAGAAFAVLNHVGSVGGVADFVARARSAGVTIPLVASVLVYTDEISASALRLPGLTMDPERVAAVLSANDPVEAGMLQAVAEARALCDIDGVVGVNLSGMASARGELFAAEVKADIGRQLIASRPDRGGAR